MIILFSCETSNSGKGQWLELKIWESRAQAESSPGGPVSRVARSEGCNVGQ